MNSTDTSNPFSHLPIPEVVLRDGKLSPLARLVYFGILAQTRSQGNTAPGIYTVAQNLGIGGASATKVRCELVSAGLVEIVRRNRDNSRCVLRPLGNVYAANTGAGPSVRLADTKRPVLLPPGIPLTVRYDAAPPESQASNPEGASSQPALSDASMQPGATTLMATPTPSGPIPSPLPAGPETSAPLPARHRHSHRDYLPGEKITDSRRRNRRSPSAASNSQEGLRTVQPTLPMSPLPPTPAAPVQAQASGMYEISPDLVLPSTIPATPTPPPPTVEIADGLTPRERDYLAGIRAFLAARSMTKEQFLSDPTKMFGELSTWIDYKFKPNLLIHIGHFEKLLKEHSDKLDPKPQMPSRPEEQSEGR